DVAPLAVAVARRWPEVRSNAVSPGWVPTRMGGAGAPDDLALGAETQAWLAAGDDPATDGTGRDLFHRPRADARAPTVPAGSLFPGQRGDVPATVHDVQAQEPLFASCAELSGQPLG